MKNNMTKQLLTLLLVATLVVFFTGSMAINAQAETTECTEIVSLPAVINVQGVYCFKQNLTTSISGGGQSAISINTNNVTIDMNGFKLGGSTAGDGTLAFGIYAFGRKNITIRNGNVRGFRTGIILASSGGSGHLIENIRADGNKSHGLYVEGNNNIIRNNHVINTGDGSVYSSANGILVQNASNTLIINNVVSHVSETSSVTGIYLANSSTIEIKGNSIYDMMNAGNKRGIHLTTSTEVATRNNQIVNPAGTGTIGIFGSGVSTGLVCVQNTTVGFFTANSGCDFTSGNLNY